MTIKLVVKPLDMGAEGSYAARNELIEAFCALEGAQESNRWRDWRAVQQRIRELLQPHLRVEGEGTVEEALTQVSANQFDQLFRALIGGESVPPANGGSSEMPTGDTVEPSLPGISG